MSNLIRSGEYRLGWRFLDNFDSVVNGGFHLPVVSKRDTTAQMPAMDINETETAYLVKAELPGMRKQDLDVTINNGILTINAERKRGEDEKTAGRLIRQERRYGKFVRSLRLGSDIDEKSIVANYRDGLLSLMLPKAKEATLRKVEVAIS